MTPVTARRLGQRSTSARPAAWLPVTAGRTWLPNVEDTTIRHRHGVPWWAARVPYRWHACRPQTVHLYSDGGVLTSTCYCACGAVSDHTGRWHGRNRRRSARSTDSRHHAPTPQPAHSRVAAGAAPYPGARRHPGTCRGATDMSAALDRIRDLRHAEFGFLVHRDARGEIATLQAARVRAGHIETVLIHDEHDALAARCRDEPRPAVVWQHTGSTCAAASGAAYRGERGRHRRATRRGRHRSGAR